MTENKNAAAGAASPENSVPDDRRYSRDHAWVRANPDGTATVGITAYAADQLGKLVFIDMPSPGDTLEAGAESFDIESGKSISPFVSPVGGTVEETNGAVYDDPTIINSDAYDAGWILTLRADGADGADGAGFDEAPGLMDAAAYADYLSTLA